MHDAVDLMEKLLGRTALLAGMSGEDVAVLAQSFELVERAAGDELCAEGEPGEALYIAESGKVKVQKYTAGDFEGELAVLEHGAVVGEMSLLDGQPCSATAVVVEGGLFHRLDASELMRLRLRCEPVVYVMLRNVALTLCERLRKLNAFIGELQADPERLRQVRLSYRRRAQRPMQVSGLMQVPTHESTGRGSGVVERRKAPQKRRTSGQTAPVPLVVADYEPGPDRHTALRTFLKQVLLLRSLSEDDLSVLTGLLREVTFETDDIICQEGDPADELYIVASGEVAVCKQLLGDQAKVLTSLRSGAMVGEVSLIDGGRRSATLLARRPTTVLALSRADFDKLFLARSPLAFRFVEIIAIDLSLRMRAAADLFAQIFGDDHAPQAPNPQDEEHITLKLDRVRTTLSTGQRQKPRLMEILGRFFGRGGEAS